MAVKIKLTRLGKIRNPQYRIAVADARTRRDGRAIEIIGRYHPKEDPSLIEIDSERAQYWLGVGAQPTEPVLQLLKITGDWQKFKGLPGAEGTLKVKEPKPSKLDLFNAALADAEGAPTTEATTPKKKKAPAKKAAEATEIEAGAAPVKDESEPAAEGADATTSPESTADGSSGEPSSAADGSSGEPSSAADGSSGEPSSAADGSSGEPSSTADGSSGEPSSTADGSSGEPSSAES